MPTPALYTICILLWGTTWYALKLQIGPVPVEVSIAYRFGAAGIVLLGFLFLKKRLVHRPFKDHGLMALQGIFMYGGGYILVYHAAGKLTSGVNSVLFSSIILTNLVMGSLFFKRPVSLRLGLGTLGSFGGICLFFWPELTGMSLESLIIQGFFECLLGVLLTSFGNIVAEYVYQRKISVIESNGYSMGYGALFSLIYALSLGYPLTIDTSFTYMGSLFYLAIFGSIITFGCYLTLLRRLGSERVGIPLISIPIVSLIISQFFENYQWSLWAFLGILGIIIGNVVALLPRKEPGS